MKKTTLALSALFICTQGLAQWGGNDPVLYTCKHLDDNTFPMTIYAYSPTSSCPPPPHSTPPWQMNSHDPLMSNRSVLSEFGKLGQIRVIPPEPECVIHSFPPTQ